MRHWYVSDDNHSHYLILADTPASALMVLAAHQKTSADQLREDGYQVSLVPTVACIDDDSGLQFYDPPTSSSL